MVSLCFRNCSDNFFWKFAFITLLTFSREVSRQVETCGVCLTVGSSVSRATGSRAAAVELSATGRMDTV